MSSAVSLFDFDGTIVRRDSTRALAKQLLQLRPWRVLMILPSVVRLRLAQTPHALQRAKCAMLGLLFRGLSEGRAATAIERAAELLQRDRRPQVIDALRRCATRGDRVLVVSASPGVFLRRALADLPVEVVATEFAIERGTFSGSMVGDVCFGDAKVPAIRSLVGPNTIIAEAWSDSLHDRSMMQMAQRRHWLCPPADEAEVRRMDPEAIVIATTGAST